jgi:hypothetical protein
MRTGWADVLTRGNRFAKGEAGDIAYLTAAFLRQKLSFKLHPVLEATPWFI